MTSEMILTYAPLATALIALLLALGALFKIGRLEAELEKRNTGAASNAGAYNYLGGVTQNELGNLKGSLSRQMERIERLEKAIGKTNNQPIRSDSNTRQVNVSGVDPRSVERTPPPEANRPAAVEASTQKPSHKSGFVAEVFYLKFDQQGSWPQSLTSSAPGENFYFKAETTSPTTASIRLIRNTSSFESLLSRPEDFSSQAFKVKNTGGSNLVDEQAGKISRANGGVWTVVEPVFITVG